MKRLIPIIIVLVLFASGSTAVAAEIKAEGAITSVVVYPDRALVARTAELELQQGDHVVVFENLPANIDTDSLRTKGEGDARVRIFSIESRKVVLEHPREEQIAQLEVEIQSVTDEIAMAKEHRNNLKAERKLVQAIGVYSGEQLSKEFITRQPQSEEWKAMVEFQRRNLARLSGQIHETDVAERALMERLDALKREWQELKGQSSRASNEVRVSLSALSPGRFRLLLSCTVFGAVWYPTYDARADVEKETVEITYIGNVRQSTGEDWEGVDLTLSTARPAIGANMPGISPWILRPVFPRVMDYEAGALEEQAIGGDFRGRPKKAASAPAGMAVAQVLQRGTSVQFKVPRPMDIPSDNAYHRATILVEELPATLSYSTTPRLSPFAYLTAKFTNTTGAPWLAGKVSVFVDGDFIGTSGIKPVAPNEKIDLGLGIDEGIKVEREELVRKEDETRIFGKRKERAFKDRITIENLKSRAVEILLIDHIPVSQHDDIVVSKPRFSEEPNEIDTDKGIVKWKLSLNTGEKKEITIEFIVTHPLDMMVGGL